MLLFPLCLISTKIVRGHKVYFLCFVFSACLEEKLIIYVFLYRILPPQPSGKVVTEIVFWDSNFCIESTSSKPPKMIKSLSTFKRSRMCWNIYFQLCIYYYRDMKVVDTIRKQKWIEKKGKQTSSFIKFSFKFSCMTSVDSNTGEPINPSLSLSLHDP